LLHRSREEVKEAVVTHDCRQNNSSIAPRDICRSAASDDSGTDPGSYGELPTDVFVVRADDDPGDWEVPANRQARRDAARQRGGWGHTARAGRQKAAGRGLVLTALAQGLPVKDARRGRTAREQS
jgi:hypothetical protein